MGGYGWNYLVVTYDPQTDPAYRSADGTAFKDEAEMLEELGIAGWELLFIREPGADRLLYYWRRGRA